MKKLISKAVKPNGRHIVKTGSYKFVLVYGDRALEKWSNKKETLEKHIKFLLKHGNYGTYAFLGLSYCQSEDHGSKSCKFVGIFAEGSVPF